MAGVKGRSGGKRQGAGRKPKIKPDDEASPAVGGKARGEAALSKIMDGEERDPLDFLLVVQNDPLMDPKLRLRAAIAAAQYKHTKRHDGGKKESLGEGARKAAEGRFSPKAPPKLVVKNG